MIPVRMRAARQARGLSLRQLAERMGYYGSKISVASLSNYENGETSPRFEEAVRMALALDLSFAQLLGEYVAGEFDGRGLA